MRTGAGPDPNPDNGYILVRYNDKIIFSNNEVEIKLELDISNNVYISIRPKSTNIAYFNIQEYEIKEYLNNWYEGELEATCDEMQEKWANNNQTGQWGKNTIRARSCPLPPLRQLLGNLLNIPV